MAASMSIMILMFAVLFSDAYCWIPRVLNGRPKGGMVGTPNFLNEPDLPPAQWFEFQRLDHFDGANKNIWKQRYFVNDTFYKPGGPIFLMIGGEGPANPVWMVEGTWIEYAEMFGAICVMLEHRYYGESHPVKDLSLKNMKYLSSRQALADIANFIDSFRLDSFPKYNLTYNKLITFGGSYSEYLSIVSDALETTGPQCNTEIRNATQTMYAWWGQPEKRPVLQKMFQLCDKIDHTKVLDLYGFFSNLAQNFANVVQYNKDNRAFEGALGTDITVETVCDIMTDSTRGSAIQRYADVNALIMKTYSQECLDFKYTKVVEDMRKTDWNSSAGEGGRQWLYQTCTEFGWFQSSDYYKQPFGDWFTFPANYTMLQCSDIFEKDLFYLINDNIDDTNRYYGGREISVTKVVFPNGSIDPWHAMGVTKDISPDATAIYIEGTAHCADMYPATDRDPPQLTAARQQIANLIANWLKN